MVGSMRRVGAAGENAAMESFFSGLRKKVLDRRTWDTREELRIAIRLRTRTEVPPAPTTSRPRQVDAHRGRHQHDHQRGPRRLTNPCHLSVRQPRPSQAVREMRSKSGSAPGACDPRRTQSGARSVLDANFLRYVPMSCRRRTSRATGVWCVARAVRSGLGLSLAVGASESGRMSREGSRSFRSARGSADR